MKNHKQYSFAFFLVVALSFSLKKEPNSGVGVKSKIDFSESMPIPRIPFLTSAYSSDVALQWIGVQLELMRTSSPFIGGLPPSRLFAYTGIALYEAVVPGMPSYRSLSGQLTDMPGMPQTLRGFGYHWPACANAVLAAMTRNFFPNASDGDKRTINELEKKLNETYKTEAGAEVFERSVKFGQEVAQLVFAWSKTDGYINANASYVPPVGPGLWAPTPPAFTAAFGPYWGNNRSFVPGSLDGTAASDPPPYSTDSSSDYFRMAKEVYDLSQKLTPDQTALALYYRDNPGFGDGHYLSILKQILEKEKPRLDFTAIVYSKTGIACVDAGIGCWKTKFRYNQERPVRYIREVLGHTSWSPVFDTPPFPDFPSGHSTIAGSFGEILKGYFGDNYHFTDHTYDYLGMAPRSYTSFDELAKEIGNSRVYAGIHYQYSCEQGCEMGRKIGRNINRKLNYLK
jgi:hypothetical protein